MITMDHLHVTDTSYFTNADEHNVI